MAADDAPAAAGAELFAGDDMLQQVHTRAILNINLKAPGC